MRRTVAILLLSVFALLAQEPEAGWLEKEKAIGWQMTNYLRDRFGRVEAPDAQVYLERLAATILGNQPDGPFCCMVDILGGGVDAPDRPISAPGGHLFVTVEFLHSRASEAELVRGVAHAVAHIRLRDWSPPRGQSMLFGSVPVMFLLQLSDDRNTVPLGLRDWFDAREQRAAGLVPDMVAKVTVGTGDYERAMESLPPPPAQPPPLSGRPSLIR